MEFSSRNDRYSTPPCSIHLWHTHLHAQTCAHNGICTTLEHLAFGAHSFPSSSFSSSTNRKPSAHPHPPSPAYTASSEDDAANAGDDTRWAFVVQRWGEQTKQPLSFSSGTSPKRARRTRKTRRTRRRKRRKRKERKSLNLDHHLDLNLAPNRHRNLALNHHRRNLHRPRLRPRRPRHAPQENLAPVPGTITVS